MVNLLYIFKYVFRFLETPTVTSNFRHRFWHASWNKALKRIKGQFKVKFVRTSSKILEQSHQLHSCHLFISPFAWDDVFRPFQHWVSGGVRSCAADSLNRNKNQTKCLLTECESSFQLLYSSNFFQYLSSLEKQLPYTPLFVYFLYYVCMCVYVRHIFFIFSLSYWIAERQRKVCHFLWFLLYRAKIV